MPRIVGKDICSNSFGRYCGSIMQVRDWINHSRVDHSIQSVCDSRTGHPHGSSAKYSLSNTRRTVQDRTPRGVRSLLEISSASFANFLARIPTPYDLVDGRLSTAAAPFTFDELGCLTAAGVAVRRLPRAHMISRYNITLPRLLAGSSVPPEQASPCSGTINSNRECTRGATENTMAGGCHTYLSGGWPSIGSPTCGQTLSGTCLCPITAFVCGRVCVEISPYP